MLYLKEINFDDIEKEYRFVRDIPFDENGFTNQDYVWAKYGVEFICEDGQWMIWKMHIFPVFSYPYDSDWTLDPAYKGFTYPNANPDRPLPRPLWLWTIDGPSPVDEPDWALDYDTYTDIGYV